MREMYDQELAEFHDRLADLAELVEAAMSKATAALLGNDLVLAREVIEGDEVVGDLHHELDQSAVELIARQQPVARDLRTIVAGLRMSADLQRMGRLAKHVAELVERRYPHQSIPSSLRPRIAAMGTVAVRIAGSAREAMLSGDADAAQKIERDDDEMDELQTGLYRQLIEGDDQADVETAVEVALLGRYYERFADHAVLLARRVAFAAGVRGAIQPQS